MSRTVTSFHGLLLNRIFLALSSRTISVQFLPCAAIEKIIRMSRISLLGPKTSAIRSVLRLFCSPSFNTFFSFPLSILWASYPVNFDQSVSPFQ